MRIILLLAVASIACASTALLPATQTPMPPPNAAPVPQFCQYTVTAEVLHVRTCPATYCGLIDEDPYLYQGERVTVKKEKAGWSELATGGWVKSEYLKGCE